MSKLDKEIDRWWNAGLTLSETHKRMNERGFEHDVQELIRGWRARKKEFGCACVVRHKPRPISDAEASQLVGPRMYGDGTYGDWKGITGPGKQLRDLLAAERANASDSSD